MRGPQATPVDPGQAEFARSRLDVAAENVVVSHGRACPDRLKDAIFQAGQISPLCSAELGSLLVCHEFYPLCCSAEPNNESDSPDTCQRI